MAETVREGKVVLIRYTVEDAATGEPLDDSGEGAFAYLAGRGNIVGGLEEALDGLEVGASFDLTVPMDKAYGARQEGWPKSVPRKELKGISDLRKGMPFRAQGSGDNTAVLWVTDIRGSRVSVDVNHPMAGKDLHFTGEILGVRDPTPEEHDHGHAHGPTGHGGH